MAYSTTPGKHTATLSLRTSNIASNDLNLSVSMNLVNTDGVTNCKYMTGIRTTTNLSGARLLFDTSEYTANSRGYVFVRNPITTTTDTTYIDLRTVNDNIVVARLYEGQFVWVPIEANVTGDLEIISNSDTETFEYCIVFENADNDYIPGAIYGEAT